MIQIINCLGRLVEILMDFPDFKELVDLIRKIAPERIPRWYNVEEGRGGEEGRDRYKGTDKEERKERRIRGDREMRREADANSRPRGD